MLDVFLALKAALKINTVNIDNFIFTLHYKFTFLFLVAASVLVTCKQYIGDPIDCIHNQGSNYPNNVMDTYCWVHSTYTNINGTGSSDFSSSHPFSAVGTSGTPKYHRYYQWVCFVLFFQALLFYAPHFLWKLFENQKMKALTLELQTAFIDPDTKSIGKKKIINFLNDNKRSNNIYALRFYFCELLNFINVVSQIYLTNKFLGNDFLTYGSEVISNSNLDPEKRTDALAHIFPTVTKCQFHSYGFSGNTQNVDMLCVLPVNIINEKIYIFLWFWFIVLATLTGLGLLYRLAIVLLPTLRFYIINRKAHFNRHQEVTSITNRCQIGNWFVLSLLSKNLNSKLFGELITDLAENLNERMNSVTYGFDSHGDSNRKE